MKKKKIENNNKQIFKFTQRERLNFIILSIFTLNIVIASHAL